MSFEIAFFGSSLLSSYWNGAATYYRGLLRALHERGHSITFYEPDAFERQQHVDLPDPDFAGSVVYEPTEEAARVQLDRAREADVVVKASGVGVLDEMLEREVLDLKSPDRLVLFWDVDAPATLERVQQDQDDPFGDLIPEYDLVCTYGGGPPVVNAYESLGARRCVPIYNALDETTHHPVEPDPRYEATLAFLGNRLPDREDRVMEFFFEPARKLPGRGFLLGGSGWAEGTPDLENVEYLGHVYTPDHNAFNCTPLAVLNISRASMARFGYSPATRVFEAAGAGACLITDAWKGLDRFLEPGSECLVAESGEEVAGHLLALTPERAGAIGRAALERVRREHTYRHRAEEVEVLVEETLAGRAEVAR